GDRGETADRSGARAEMSAGRQSEIGPFPSAADARGGAERGISESTVGGQIEADLQSRGRGAAAQPLDAVGAGQRQTLVDRVIEETGEVISRSATDAGKVPSDEEASIGLQFDAADEVVGIGVESGVQRAIGQEPD